MANTTNYNWETPDDTDLVKDGAAAIRTLGNSIDTTTKALNPETTLGDIAYRSSTSNTNTRLPIGSNGQILGVSAGVPAWINNDQGDITEVQAGTGISVASGTGPIPVITNTVATAFDAAGDLVYGTGADTFTKLSLGTAGKVLTVNSGATAPEWATPAAGGKVLQVVQATYSTSTSNSTSTYADTGLSATITPSTTGSRILCMIYHPIRRGGGNANNKLGIRLVRTSTTIHQSPDLLYTDTLAAHEADGAYSLAYVDSPSTTSATTYKTTFANIANAASVAVQVDSRTAVMILTEIGA